jgi:integrase
MEDVEWPFGSLGKLLLLTGQRAGEVAGMRWSELDTQKAIWSLPGDRTKNGKAHIVFLSPPALAVIEGLPVISNKANLVFTTTGKSILSGLSYVKMRVDALMRDSLGDLEPFVWHDLRRTVVTGMNEMGIQPHVIEAVVNHVSGSKSGIAGVYNRAVYAEQRKAALDSWGRYVDSLIGRGTDNVVRLRS